MKREKFDVEVPENYFLFEKIRQGPKKELVGNNALTTQKPPASGDGPDQKTVEPVDGPADEPGKAKKGDDLWKSPSQNIAK